MYDKQNVFGVFCASDVPPVIMAVGTELFIDFQSDTEVHDRGFVANYSIVRSMETLISYYV